MRKRLIALVFAAGIYQACGSDDGGGGPNPPATNTLAKASGDNQDGTVDAALASAFCARVTASGANKEGVTVNWSTVSGGSLSVPSSVTGTDGLACVTLTLGTTSGTQSAQAAVPGANGSPVTFVATAAPGPAASLASTSGDGQSAVINTDLPNPLVVKVSDQFGNGVGGELVTWAVTSGSATLNPVSANSNAAGNGTTNVTLGGTAGAIVITASSGTLSGSPVSFDATADTPPVLPTDITIVLTNNVFTPSVDTVAAGGTVTWDWNSGGVPHSVTSVNNPSFVSDPAGEVVSPHSYGPITFTTPGVYFYYCTQHGSPGTPPTGMSGRIVVM